MTFIRKITVFVAIIAVIMIASLDSVEAKVTLSDYSTPSDNCQISFSDDVRSGPFIDQFITIDTRDGTFVYLNYWYRLDSSTPSEENHLVVPPGEYIQSTIGLNGVVYDYPSTCRFGQVIEQAVQARDYRMGQEVPTGDFYAEWQSTGVFVEVND